MSHEFLTETADVAAAHDFFTAKMAFTCNPGQNSVFRRVCDGGLPNKKWR